MLRFVTMNKDQDSGHRQGILVFAHEFRQNNFLTKDDDDFLYSTLNWFNTNLLVPTILENIEHKRAISWFQENALEPIKKMWDLKCFLENHGVYVELIKTQNPGTIIYSDALQIVAKPPKNIRFK
jgi:hypothetical protein